MGVKHLTDLDVLVAFTPSVWTSGVLYDVYMLHVWEKKQKHMDITCMQMQKGKGKTQQ